MSAQLRQALLASADELDEGASPAPVNRAVSSAAADKRADHAAAPDSGGGGGGDDDDDPFDLPLVNRRAGRSRASSHASASSAGGGEKKAKAARLRLTPALERLFQFVWTVLFASLAASLSYWIGLINLSFYHINCILLIQNVLGAAIISVATAFQQIQFQYVQTYMMYNAIKGGFCSVFTTFGNLIEDTARLLYTGNWWESPVNFLATLLFAFGIYQIGRLIALRWKAGSKFSLALMKMENEEARMQHELDVQLSRSVPPVEPGASNAIAPSKLARRRSIRQSLLSRAAPIDIEAPPPSDADARVDSGDDSASPRLRRPRSVTLSRPVELPKSEEQVLVFESHLRQQLEKFKRHTYPFPLRRHIILMVFSALPTIATATIVLVRAAQFPNDANATIQPYSFGVSLGWAVLGALIGGAIGENKKKNDVQWGTFRCNMISCILIGAAHNLLLFRHYFPGTSSREFTIAVTQFVSSYCGSASSFAGLIDETSVLFNSKLPRKVPVRNLFYNLFVGLIVFLVVVFSVRVLFFFR